MSAIKFVPITLTTATDLLVLLRTDLAFVSEASRLTTILGEAISIAGEHVSEAEMLAAELLELIGRVSGRSLSTIPGNGSLAAAEDALSEMGPVLGKVLHLPRAANTDAKALDAAVARGLADMPGPIDLRAFVRHPDGNCVELEPVPVWCVPARGTLWCGCRVIDVEGTPGKTTVILAANPPEDIAF
jgi:hypothetical protein